MSIQAHVQATAGKRAQLKTQIAEEMAHPSPNFELIRQLKKQNMLLKEQMWRDYEKLKKANVS